MITESEVLRILIVQNAMHQVFQGAHYLNGSEGEFPGIDGGLKKGMVDLIDDPDENNMAVRTAQWGGWSCAGRCDKVDGAKKVGKSQAVEMEKLKKYCEKLQDQKSKGIPPSAWSSFEDSGYFPRTGIQVKTLRRKVVISEDCSKKRHFDCISFIQWVLTTTLFNPVMVDDLWDERYSFNIVQHVGYKQNDDTLGKRAASGKLYKAGSFPNTLKNADLLIRIKWNENEKDTDGKYPKNKKGKEVKYSIGSKHIGFYMVGGKVVEASSAANGVIISNYPPGRGKKQWTHLFRFRDRFLKIGPTV